MKFRNVLYQLQQMSEAELDQPASVYMPHFRRSFELVALEHLDVIIPDRARGDGRLALITARNPTEKNT